MAKQQSEFFEAFRPSDEGAPQAPAPPPPSSAPQQQQAGSTKEASLLGPSLAIGRARGTGLRRFSFDVNHAVIAGVGAVSLALLLAAWVWGYYAGRASVGPLIAKAPEEKPLPKKPATSRDAGGDRPGDATEPADTPKPKTLWTLCVVHYRTQDRATATARKLKELKFKSIVIRLKDNKTFPYAVGVGLVGDPKDAKAKDLRRSMRAMDFGNQKKPFKDAYFVRIK